MRGEGIGEKEPTIGGYTLEGFLQQINPVHIQRMQPRRVLQRLEIMGVFVSILIAHHLEALQTQVGQVLTVLARRLLQFSGGVGHDGRIATRQKADEPVLQGEERTGRLKKKRDNEGEG